MEDFGTSGSASTRNPLWLQWVSYVGMAPEDVMDVDYVAWQADHDAYGFSGQKLGSTFLSCIYIYI